MSPRHIVRREGDATWAVPPVFEGHAEGLRRWTVVDEVGGAVHTGFGIGEMDPGGHVDWHVHSYEESLFVMEGELVLRTADAAVRMVAGDYGLIPTAVPHALVNEESEVARWAALSAPQPRPAYGGDTYFVPRLPERDPVPVDVRDPRTRSFGHIGPEDLLVANQTQDRMAVSASARTALLVYSGVTLKMMIDSELGAQLCTMFMLQNDEGGGAGPHDHPFEETYLILEGEVDATFDGERYHLGPGDVGWTGVGCVHSFSNEGPGHVRWLETQAPAPPARHSYRFARDWTYLREAIEQAEAKEAR